MREEAQEEIRQLLRRIRRTPVGAEDDFRLTTADQIIRNLDRILSIVVLVSIALALAWKFRLAVIRSTSSWVRSTLARSVAPARIGEAMRSLAVLHIAGANVTGPFKEAVIPYMAALAEGGTITPKAQDGNPKPPQLIQRERRCGQPHPSQTKNALTGIKT